MYNNPYPVVLLNKESCESNGIEYTKRIYRFDCRFGHRYYIWAEHYPYDLFAIKFFLATHEHNQRKFKILSGINDAFRVFSTCIGLMQDLHKEIPISSFGFVGTALVREEESNTKRLKVYRRIMEDLFSPVNFKHYIYEPKSAYLVLNRKLPIDDPFKKVEKMISKIYDFGSPQKS
jgi:hypothetical protein